MITRRNVLRLGAAGLVTPSAGAVFGAGNHAVARSGRDRSLIPFRQAERPDHALSSGPSLDAPIVVKWTYETYAEYATTPVIVDGILYGSVAGTYAYALDAETGAEIWRKDLDASWSQPVVYEGQTYVSESGVLICLDNDTWEERWRFEPSSTLLAPHVSNGTLYIGVENGEIYALDTQTGAVKWTFFAGQTYTTSDNSVVTIDQTVLVTMGSPVLYALDAETGMQKWNFFTQGYTINRPVIQVDQIYIASGEGLHALDIHSGEEIWRFAFETARSSGPLLNDGVLYWAADSGPLHAVDASSGLPIWEYTLGEYPAYRIQVDDEICTFEVATGGQMFPYYNLHGVDKHTGELRWRTEDVWNNMLPTLMDDGTVVVAEYHTRAVDQEHSLYALDSSTGAEIWRLWKPGGFRSWPTAADGNLYVAGGLGTVYCLGNLKPAVLLTDVTLRGAPTSTGIERGTAPTGSEISSIGVRDSSSGSTWVEVTIDGIPGWIPLDAIDSGSIPPEGEVEYVYVPE